MSELVIGAPDLQEVVAATTRDRDGHGVDAVLLHAERAAGRDHRPAIPGDVAARELALRIIDGEVEIDDAGPAQGKGAVTAAPGAEEEALRGIARALLGALVDSAEGMEAPRRGASLAQTSEVGGGVLAGLEAAVAVGPGVARPNERAGQGRGVAREALGGEAGGEAEQEGRGEAHGREGSAGRGKGEHGRGGEAGHGGTDTLRPTHALPRWPESAPTVTVFSMSLAVLQELTPRPQQVPVPPESAPFLRTIPGVRLGRPALDLDEGRTRSLPVRLGGLDEVLPDGGLPRGAVVELAAPYGLARATSIALAACASAQEEARVRGGEGTTGAWCAWLEPASEVGTGAGAGMDKTSLFAPAVARAGVDLARLLVIRPSVEALGRVAARVAQSRVFSVIVVDLAGVPGRRTEVRLDRWVNPVRRLAIAVEGLETTVILLTDALTPRALPLPVALRLEVDRPAVDRLRLTVAKDRRGRVAPARSVMLPSAAVSPRGP